MGMDEEAYDRDDRLRLALRVGQLAMWDWDIPSGRVFWSEEHYRMQGYAVGSVAPSYEAWLARVHPDDRAAAEAALVAARDQRTEYRHEFRCMHPDGSKYFLSARGKFFYDEHGTPLRMIGVMRDVTEHVRAERVKDEFLAMLGHELRTPLAAITLWAEALRTGSIRGAQVEGAVDAIAHSAASLSRLVDDMLDLSRLSLGMIDFVPVPTDMRALVCDAIDVVRPLAGAKGLALDVDVAANVDVAVVDPARLKQVFLNLLTNAVNFTPQGGRVRARAYRDEGAFLFEITDTGKGITRDFMPYLFERFRQADMTEARPHAGLGIGLALAKQLTELHDGTIEAASDGEGRGATFRVRLPWVSPSSVSRTRARADDGAKLEDLRVLLVEDDDETRLSLAEVLTREGARVLAVATAAEALAVIARGEVDVLMSDLVLRDMSGLELIAVIGIEARAHGVAPLPSCAVTARAREAERRRAIDAGFDLYLTKPVTPEALLEAAVDLRDLLRRRTSDAAPAPLEKRDA